MRLARSIHWPIVEDHPEVVGRQAPDFHKVLRKTEASDHSPIKIWPATFTKHYLGASLGFHLWLVLDLLP